MKTICIKSVLILAGIIIALLTGCGQKEAGPDAYGNFESVETVVSARAEGNLERFLVEEGQLINASQEVGLVDTVQLYLKKQQLTYSRKSLQDKLPNIQPELDVLHQQITVQQREKERTQNLLDVGAATAKQLDDINAQIQILQRQLAARRAALNTQTSSTLSESGPLKAQIAQIDDQLRKSRIVNPEKGIVLVKYAEPGETVRYGTPLYKIANMDEIILRAFVAGDQLNRVRIGQNVNVRIDVAGDAYKYFPGIVEWVSSQAEFTPKIIQTKEERVNMVYAIKVRVKNPGDMKIGMPGEVFLDQKATENKN